MNVVTSLCIDPYDESHNFQLYYLNHEQKRLTYWKCCVVFFATLLRTNPKCKGICFTNDKAEVVIGNIDFKALLKSFGTEIIYLPFQGFEKFRGNVKYHFPTLYKFQVISEISKFNDNAFSLFLDSDCVWTKPFDVDNLNFDKPLIYDVYQRKDIHDSSYNGFSRAEMGKYFKMIDPEYPVDAPKLFGGEILGGSRQIFKIISMELEHYLSLLSDKKLTETKFPNNKSILDGDEYLFSMIYNKIFANYTFANGCIKRIWTLKKPNNTLISDLDLPVWHVISEKLTGIPDLFTQVIDENSEFWTMDMSKFNLYLGSYLNIPLRKYKFDPITDIQTMYRKLVFKLKNLVFEP
jgi:hypothetical protein